MTGSASATYPADKWEIVLDKSSELSTGDKVKATVKLKSDFSGNDANDAFSFVFSATGNTDASISQPQAIAGVTAGKAGAYVELTVGETNITNIAVTITAKEMYAITTTDHASVTAADGTNGAYTLTVDGGATTVEKGHKVTFKVTGTPDTANSTDGEKVTIKYTNNGVEATDLVTDAFTGNSATTETVTTADVTGDIVVTNISAAKVVVEP